jgi:hypothetical protein
MTLSDELHSLAESLVGAGWQTHAEVDWGPEEHRAYHRWAKAERERQDKDAKARGAHRPVDFIPTTHEESEHERKTAIGAFLRPYIFTLRFGDGNETMEQYGPDHESSRTYVGIDLEDV